MDAILPAAGLATRMHGIPKFLLPSSEEYDSLIGLHIDNLIKHCERIWIPTRPELKDVWEISLAKWNHA